MINVYNPRSGYKIASGRCAASVVGVGAYFSHQCTRKIVNHEDGHGWCKQHTPSVYAERQKKLHAKWDAEWAAKNRGWDRANAYKEIAAVAIKLLRQEASYDDLEKAVAAYERMKEPADVYKYKTKEKD
jgi:hypothetical protein